MTCNALIGAIADAVAPKDGEPIITKNFPNSFVQTDLDDQLKAKGIHNIILAGFMTHMCINSTAHGGFGRPGVCANRSGQYNGHPLSRSSKRKGAVYTGSP